MFEGWRQPWRLWALALALTSVGGLAHAQKVTIYRCTDAKGALTVQNDVPCPKGSKQDKREIDPAPRGSAPPMVITGPAPGGELPFPGTTVPAPAAHHSAPATPAPAPTATTPATKPAANTPAGAKPTTPAPAALTPTIVVDRLPPPILYECRTYNGSRYYGDDGNPQQRCVPLRTTNLGGSNEDGNGLACEMTSDTCQRIAPETLCESWKQRLLEAESELRFGRAENREAAQTDVERFRRIATESTCGATK